MSRYPERHQGRVGAAVRNILNSCDDDDEEEESRQSGSAPSVTFSAVSAAARRCLASRFRFPRLRLRTRPRWQCSEKSSLWCRKAGMWKQGEVAKRKRKGKKREKMLRLNKRASCVGQLRDAVLPWCRAAETDNNPERCRLSGCTDRPPTNHGAQGIETFPRAGQSSLIEGCYHRDVRRPSV